MSVQGTNMLIAYCSSYQMNQSGQRGSEEKKPFFLLDKTFVHLLVMIIEKKICSIQKLCSGFWFSCIKIGHVSKMDMKRHCETHPCVNQLGLLLRLWNNGHPLGNKASCLSSRPSWKASGLEPLCFLPWSSEWYTNKTWKKKIQSAQGAPEMSLLFAHVCQETSERPLRALWILTWCGVPLS